MCRGSLDAEGKAEWQEEHSKLSQFLAGEGERFKWLTPLPLPNLERVISNYGRRYVPPERLDELERKLRDVIPEIDALEADYLQSHPSATPLMRNGDRCRVLFFQRKTRTRDILRLLVCIRTRMDYECDRAFPPDPNNGELDVLLDLVRVALRQGYQRSEDLVGFIDLATGLPGCFSGAGHHPLQVSLASHARHRQPLRVNAGVDTNHAVELWMVNHLRKSWRWPTLVSLLQSAIPSLRPTLEVLVRHGVLPPCALPDVLVPTEDLEDAWYQNGSS